MIDQKKPAVEIILSNVKFEGGHHKAGVKFRLDIQGLRGLAIIAVVLFHMWSHRFKYGYLGVDVFFVISGFLMATLLDRQRPTKLAILNFYFRRLKRILPLYLTTILVILVVAVLLMHPFDYSQLLAETFPSIFFFANHPAVHAYSYFDLKTSNYFFAHVWSLCVELQFYLVAPFLSAFLQHLHGMHPIFSYFLIVYLQLLSYWRQAKGYGSNLDGQHMMPDARFWQFLCGFVAFRLNKWWLDRLRNDNVSNVVSKSVHGISTAGLVVFLFCDVGIEDRQLHRLIVTVISTLIISMPPPSQTQILYTRPLTELGSFSYSLYLVHWPLFSWHRYLHPQKYDLDFVFGKEVEWKCKFLNSMNEKTSSVFSVGLALILVASLFGFLLEEAFKRFQKHLKSWLSLLASIGSIYFCIGILIVYLGHNIMWPFDMSSLSTPEWARSVERNIQTLWENRNENLSISRKEALHLNRELFKYNNFMIPCDRNTSAPTGYNVTYLDNTYICKYTGRGHKNIVIIGNSHALFSHTGIKHHFRDVYANLTLYAATACMLAPLESQIPIIKDKCRFYMKELVPALRKWKHRIDIIMIFFGYARFQDHPIKGPLEEDEMFKFMQDLHTNLTEIAQDLVFVSNVSIYFAEDQTRVIQKRLQYKEEFGKIGSTVKTQLEYLPSIRKRMRYLQCQKCIRIDFLRLWCPDQAFCPSVDRGTRIAYFADYHHVSAYGSMFLGEYMRQLYDNYNNGTEFNK